MRRESPWSRLIALFRLPGALPLITGVLTFTIVWVGHSPPEFPSDFDYFWTAGGAIAHGVNPYEAVREAVQQGMLRRAFYYPATTALVSAPFGILPHRLAVALFTALGMSLLAWSVAGGAPWRRWIVV